MPNAVDTLIAAFPWLGQMGIQQKLIEWARDGITGDALIGLVRQTDQWKERFVGIKRADGTLRMNEARYLETEDSYRQLLRQVGQPDYRYDSPYDFQAFFDNEVSPSELKQRFDVYRQIKSDAGPIKDAFYVYAGMRFDDDQWYQYFADPQTRRAYDDEYNQRTAAGKLDYATWVSRATEAGLARVTEALQQLEQNGVATGGAIQNVRTVDPEFARTMVDALYHGGDPQGGKFLSLEELMSSFEYAMIGSAATQNGLNLPAAERIQAIRNAGIDRARALERYASYASQKNLVSSMVQRAGGGSFGQNEFEQAVFLQQADEQELLRRAQAQETALGKSGGAASFSQGAGGLAQTGLGLR